MVFKKSMLSSITKEVIMVKLTAKEAEILQLVAEGLNNIEISKIMVTTVHTVKAHLTSIMKKLGVTNRTAAAYVALKNHLVK